MIRRLSAPEIADKAISMLLEELERRDLCIVHTHTRQFARDLGEDPTNEDDITSAKIAAVHEVKDAQDFEDLSGEGPTEKRDAGVRVTAEDLSGKQESMVVEIQDDYVIICAGSCYISHENYYPKTGTVQLTIKGRR